QAAALAREARVMLEREAARGRDRILLAANASEPPVESALTLPGFEKRVRAPIPAFAPPPPVTVTFNLRPDLPDDLGTLQRMVSECRKCGLCGTRTHTVFADGSPRARLVFIREAP